MKPECRREFPSIHRAKGLEYCAVFLPMIVHRRFPVENRSRNWLIEIKLFDAPRYLTDLDDERGLFYVALTRARAIRKPCHAKYPGRYEGTHASCILGNRSGWAEFFLNFLERETLGFRINEEDHKKLDDHHH